KFGRVGNASGNAARIGRRKRQFQKSSPVLFSTHLCYNAANDATANTRNSISNVVRKFTRRDFYRRYFRQCLGLQSGGCSPPRNAKAGDPRKERYRISSSGVPFSN